jgi:Mg-chelatase subunit ChlD
MGRCGKTARTFPWMRRSLPCSLAAAALFALALPGAPLRAANETPAVARPRLGGAPSGAGATGTVFFVKLPSGSIAAVGAAHSFDLGELAKATAVDFHLGATGKRVARSERLLAPPGRPFRDAQGALAEDIMVFALAGPLEGARALEPAMSGEIRAGERVRLLGVPAMVKQDEDDLFGRIAAVDDDRIDVDLDVKADLRGWGGAPVLAAGSGRVIGVVEAALPNAGTFRIGLAPIHAVLDATEKPLEGGLGARFAGFAPEPAEDADAAQGAPDGDGGEAEVAEAPAADPDAAGDFRAGEAADVAVFEQAESELEARLEEARAKTRANQVTEVEIAIDYPENDAVFDSAAGAFLAGTALAARGDRKRFDVVLVLDTSGSTQESSNADVNGNGVIGSGGVRGLFGVGGDPGDSILAAEVAAARRLLSRFDPRNVRVGLVTFAGHDPVAGGGIVIQLGAQPPNAMTDAPLTSDFAAIDSALLRVQERGPVGQTHMAAGLDQATIELMGLRGALSETDPKTQKLVVFLTDGLPTLPTQSISYNIRACLRAADRARRNGIKVHTFALGTEALSGPIAVVDMARHTGGTFTPVKNPGEIVSMIEGVSLVDLASLRIRNLTTQKDVPDVEVRIDGGFGALIELAPGKNRVEVVATATDGVESRAEVTLHFAPGAGIPEVPPALLPMRNALLERRLANLKAVGLGMEREQVESTRRAIALSIEEQRRLAEERAAAQRRQLEIEARDVAAPPDATDPNAPQAPAPPEEPKP